MTVLATIPKSKTEVRETSGEATAVKILSSDKHGGMERQGLL